MLRSNIIIFFALLIVSTLIYAAASRDYTVTYKNQAGSTFILTWHPERSDYGTLDGTFMSAKSVCRKAGDLPAQVNGVFSGNSVAMTISFPKCNKVIAISANVDKTAGSLQTLWVVPSKTTQQAFDSDGSNVISADSFVKIAS